MVKSHQTLYFLVLADCCALDQTSTACHVLRGLDGLGFSVL